MRVIKALTAASALAVTGLSTIGTASAKTGEDEWAPQTFMLDNGMEVIVLPDHRAPVVTHMVWYRVGAADEEPGKSGIAHFFEHLMFKGTDDIPPGEFSKIVARNGGQDNAFTSWDYTAYFQRVAKDRLEAMMRMEADRMTDLVLSDEEVLPEREVVKEERRQVIENNPGRQLFEKVMAGLYGDHPYAIPIIGFMDEIEELDREDAIEFYQQWYGPENAVLVVAGDITETELRPLAEEIYGSIAPKGDLQVRDWPDIPELTKDAIIEHTDPKVRQPSVSFYWQGVSYSQPDQEADAYALDVAMQIFGGGRTSRLFQALVERDKLAVGASAWSWNTLADSGPISLGATPAREVTLASLEDALLRELDAFIEEGPTEDELKRAKSNLVAASIFQRDSQSSMAQMYGAARARGDSLESIAAWPEGINAVTADDVTRVLRTYTQRPKITARLVLPEAE